MARPRFSPIAARSGRIPGAIGIDRRIFNEMDELLRSLRRGTREFQFVMNTAVHLLARTNLGIVQAKYRGPHDPSYRFVKPWLIPIPRRSTETYTGWHVRAIAPGIWAVSNERRGAYMVEFGIVRGGGGVRRPVLKMSGIATLRFIARTRFANRIMADTFGHLQDNKGHFRSFSARMAGSSLLGIVGPRGVLPG